jgi:hypothetical protein
MYLALFLVPWMLMYSLSTMVMNHREFFKQRYGGSLEHWDKEKELRLPLPFNSNAPPREVGEQVLRELRLKGNFNARFSRDRQKLTILRTDPITPRRIVYMPGDGKLLVEKSAFRSQTFLESLHRRRGYQSPVLLDDLWGASVDLAIVAMVFWVLSGLWMWWELKGTRWLGALFALTGCALYALFFLSI